LHKSWGSRNLKSRKLKELDEDMEAEHLSGMLEKYVEDR
jgi:hypothetical protein